MTALPPVNTTLPELAALAEAKAIVETVIDDAVRWLGANEDVSLSGTLDRTWGEPAGGREEVARGQRTLQAGGQPSRLR